MLIRSRQARQARPARQARRARLTLIAALLVGVLLTLSAASAAFAEGGQLSLSGARTTSFPKVTVRIAASEASGVPIGGLEPANFFVQENGRRVESFELYPLQQGKTPLSIVLAIDVSGSMNDDGKILKARAAAKTFISELRSIDRVELISFNPTVTTVLPFTSNRLELNKALDGLVAKGDTALYDAVDRAVSDAARADEGNRVVVVLSDGEDTASKGTLAQGLDLAAQNRVPIYAIGLGADVKDDVLARMAAETSGRYFKAPKADDLEYAFKLLSRQINNQYELYYFSPLAHQPAAKVDVVVSLVRPATLPLEASFSYVMPAAKTEERAGPVDPGELRLVPEAPRSPAPRPASPLPPYWAEALALLFGGGVLVAFAGLALGATPDVTETRLSTFVAATRGATARHQTARFGSNLILLLARPLAGVVTRLLPSRQVQETRHFLILAGNPHGLSVEEFVGLRALLGLALGVVAYSLVQGRGAFMAAVFVVSVGGVGFLLPIFWLRSRIKTRQREIFRAMPNALDLLSVSVEAGLGFDQALGEVCAKWQNALTREFATLLGELQIGLTRREALRGLMDRTGVPELGGFASALIQADELGASIARTLTVQAEQIRIRRRQRAEQLAHEASIKMLFPLVFLMLPSLFIVILGPSVPTILGALGNVAR